jgi:hypothetical protein
MDPVVLELIKLRRNAERALYYALARSAIKLAFAPANHTPDRTIKECTAIIEDCDRKILILTEGL